MFPKLLRIHHPPTTLLLVGSPTSLQPLLCFLRRVSPPIAAYLRRQLHRPQAFGCPNLGASPLRLVFFYPIKTHACLGVSMDKIFMGFEFIFVSTNLDAYFFSFNFTVKFSFCRFLEYGFCSFGEYPR